MYACIHARGAADLQQLIDCASSFSPCIEAGKDHVLIDVRGLRSLMGGPDKIADRIRGRTESAGLSVNIAIAGNPETARIAAKGFTGVTVIHSGNEGPKIASLPVNLLTEDEDILDTLADWGVRTLGDFASLPEAGIAERFGAAGVSLHNLAGGNADRPLTAHKDTPVFSSSLGLEHALDTLEPLSFVLSRLLHEICDALTTHSLATNEIRLDLTLEDKSTFTRTLRLPFATRETGTFLRLFQYDLAAHPPEAAIERISMTAEPVHPRVVQHGLFIPMAPQPEKLELTLARVSAIVGDENVGSPELLDTHCPGAFRIVRFDAAERQPRGSAIIVPRLAIRLFRPPLPATVSASNGRPQKIRARGVSGDVVTCGGPWRVSGGWWSLAPWQRDEWDIELESGVLYRVYRDGSKGWFVDGNYD
jgi:protein ImuB